VEVAVPIAVRFDEERRLIHVTVTGTWPTLPEIVAERSRLIMSGIIRPGVVELCDARGVTRGIPNLSQMQAILQSISKPPDKRAIIVSSSIQLSAGRLAELLDPKGLKVFRDEDAAIAWLLEKDAPDPPVKFDRSLSGRIVTVRRVS
jgi:hypothetical protein